MGREEALSVAVGLGGASAIEKITSAVHKVTTELVEYPTQLTLMTWICQLCSMTITSEKYERTKQGNLLQRNQNTNKLQQANPKF